jgi:hypothetical protein
MLLHGFGLVLWGFIEVGVSELYSVFPDERYKHLGVVSSSQGLYIPVLFFYFSFFRLS